LISWGNLADQLDSGETVSICEAEDISDGVTASLKNYDGWTLFTRVAGAIDITVELSPDNTDTWYEIPESPLSYTEATDDANEVGYDATDIRLTGSNTTDVTADVRGIY